MVRFKKRYLVCEIVTEHDLPSKKIIGELQVYQAIHNAVIAAHGDYGIGLMKKSLNVKYYNIGTRIVFIRIKRAAQPLLQSALAFIKKIADLPCSLQTLHVAGTIRSAQKFLIRHHKRQLPELMKKCKTQEEKKKVQLSIRKACQKTEMYRFPTEKEEEFSEDDLP